LWSIGPHFNFNCGFQDQSEENSERLVIGRARNSRISEPEDCSLEEGFLVVAVEDGERAGEAEADVDRLLAGAPCVPAK
jgi:hypothetical protein